jgi:hypothetical protein
MVRLALIVGLLVCAAALPPLPFTSFKEFYVGLYTGFMGAPGEIASNCLPQTFQMKIHMDMTTVEEDYKTDAGIQKLVTDATVVIDDFTKIADGCEVLLIPERFLESLFGEGLIAMAVRLILHILPVMEYLEAFADNAF